MSLKLKWDACVCASAGVCVQVCVCETQFKFVMRVAVPLFACCWFVWPNSTAIWPKCLLQCKQFCGFKLRIRRVKQPARHGLINNRNHINLKLISRINTDSARREGKGLGEGLGSQRVWLCSKMHFKLKWKVITRRIIGCKDKASTGTGRGACPAEKGAVRSGLEWARAGQSRTGQQRAGQKRMEEERADQASGQTVCCSCCCYCNK